MTSPPSKKEGAIKRRRLTPEETERVLRDIGGIVLDGIPLDDAGHAQRVFDIARDEGTDIALVTRDDGGSWITFDPTIGRWSRQAAKPLIGSWVIEVGNLLADWARILRIEYERELDLDPLRADDDRRRTGWTTRVG